MLLQFCQRWWPVSEFYCAIYFKWLSVIMEDTSRATLPMAEASYTAGYGVGLIDFYFSRVPEYFSACFEVLCLPQHIRITISKYMPKTNPKQHLQTGTDPSVYQFKKMHQGKKRNINGQTRNARQVALSFLGIEIMLFVV